MTVKEYLGQYVSAGNEIDTLMDEMQRLKSLAEKSTMSFDNDGGASGSRKTDKIPEAVEKIMEIEEDIGKRVSELAVLRINIYNTICKVNDGKSRVILMKRYIGNASFERISADMGYTYNHVVKNLHPEALAAVEKIINPETVHITP